MINDLEEVLKLIFKTRQTKPSEVLEIDLRKIAYEIYNIPASVKPSNADAWVKSRELLDEGASYGETARSTGVERRTVAAWFPGRGWEPTGSSSAFLRKGEKAVEKAVGKW